MADTTIDRGGLDAGKGHPAAGWLFLALLGAGLVYVVLSLGHDLVPVQETSIFPFLLLGIALLIALGFEFVNGFHDTANAVATVIYTHSLAPNFAVIWSGAWNFLGVLTSVGTVAFGIISLLPVELILQVGSQAGFAMVFALLIAAIIWNLFTWYLGLPSSSSHTLIGSIVGVGLMNQWISGPSGTSGVDWGQVQKIGTTLLVSPLIGFVASALLLLLAKALIKVPKLYTAPKGNAPPPFWIRALLIGTCTGVSFAHGSNDGQKGMGLIMLILIGTVPTAFALNRAVTPEQTVTFVAISHDASHALSGYIPAGAPIVADGHQGVTTFVRTRHIAADSVPALRALVDAVATDVGAYGSFAQVPTAQVSNVRNEMYLASEALRLMQKSATPAFKPADTKILTAYKKQLDGATKFIPTWVKVAVAIALGLGTMVGWKRIVVTVGEKIGKEHLTYGQGAAAELVAMATIEAADIWGLPVSTTHVLSSGVAGTMAANGSGLQLGTLRNLAMAWILTLPASIILSGSLFWVFRHVF